MLRLVLRRLAWSVPLLLVASVVSFVFVALLPGDAASALGGPNATPAQVSALRRELGLDQPIWQQYGHWLSAALHGDLGSSLLSRQPVTALLDQRLGASLSLIVGAVLVAGTVGVLLGVRSALRGRVGKLVDATSVLGLAVPDFWLGLVLVLVFSVHLSWLPPTGYSPLTAGLSGWLSSLVLPVVTLAVPATAVIAKQTRDAVATALDKPYVKTLRAAGVGERSIIYRHALKNAAVPILTVVGLMFVGALSGTIVVESVFAIPGLGSTAVQATAASDLPVIQGTVVYFTLIVVAVNVLVDVGYGYFNPRVRVR